MDGNAASITNGAGSTAAASSAAQAEQLESFSSSASFKYQGFICKGHLPSLQQTASPLTILPGFLEVLGRKIDSCTDVLEPWIEVCMCDSLLTNCSSRSMLNSNFKERVEKIGGARAEA